MNTFKTFSVALGLTLLGLVAQPVSSYASSILVDDGSYTYDPATNLDWLDVTATAGLSHEQVDFSSYVRVDGWHYATLSDVLSLVQDAGIALQAETGGYETGLYSFTHLGGDSNPDFPVFFSQVENLANLLGGMTSETDATFGPNSDVGTFSIFTQSDFYAGIGITSTGYPDYASHGGNLLIRDAEIAATPLPASAYLFMSGLGLIGFVAWRNKRGGFARSMAA